MRDMVAGIHGCIKAEQKARLHVIMSRHGSRQEELFSNQVEILRDERIHKIQTFLAAWKRLYGFDYFPQCGCEERIPRNEFEYIKGLTGLCRQ